MERWYYQVNGGNWESYQYIDIELSDHGIALIPQEVARQVAVAFKLTPKDTVVVCTKYPRTFQVDIVVSVKEV